MKKKRTCFAFRNFSKTLTIVKQIWWEVFYDTRIVHKKFYNFSLGWGKVVIDKNWLCSYFGDERSYIFVVFSSFIVSYTIRKSFLVYFVYEIWNICIAHYKNYNVIYQKCFKNLFFNYANVCMEPKIDKNFFSFEQKVLSK